MQTSILVISNYRNSSMSYMSSLRAYGFEVEDTRTFETARILLRTGSHPKTIIIDVKFHADEISEFARFVRREINPSINIINVGHEDDYLHIYDIDVYIERPADFQHMIPMLEATR